MAKQTFGNDLESMLFCNYVTSSQIYKKKIATEVLKKTEKSLFNGFILCYRCDSVAKKIYPARGLRHSIHSKSEPKHLFIFKPF